MLAWSQCFPHIPTVHKTYPAPIDCLGAFCEATAGLGAPLSGFAFLKRLPYLSIAFVVPCCPLIVAAFSCTILTPSFLLSFFLTTKALIYRFFGIRFHCELTAFVSIDYFTISIPSSLDSFSPIFLKLTTLFAIALRPPSHRINKLFIDQKANAFALFCLYISIKIWHWNGITIIMMLEVMKTCPALTVRTK